MNRLGFGQQVWKDVALLVLAARNLCLAEEQNLDVLTLCPGCAGTLRKVNKSLQEDKKHKQVVNDYLKEIGMEFKGGKIKVRHLIQALVNDLGFEKIKEAVVKPLTGWKVAEHNGCHCTRLGYLHYGCKCRDTI